MARNITFRIIIQTSGPTKSSVAVNHLIAGNDLDQPSHDIENQTLLDQLIPYLDQPKHYGTLLGQHLFKERILEQWWKTIGAAQEKHLLIELINKNPELNTIQWSWLCGPIHERNQWDFFNQHQRFTYAVVVETAKRRITQKVSQQGLNKAQSLLIITNSPAPNNAYHLTHIDDHYLKHIAKHPAISHSQYLNHNNSPIITNAIRDHCSQNQCQIMHILAHGAVINGRYQLYLWGPDQPIKPYDSDAFIRCLSQISYPPACIVLSLCYSSANPDYNKDYEHLAYRLIIDVGVAYVIGMTDSVQQDTAKDFSNSFYQQLAISNSVIQAFSEALLNIQHHPDALVPMLYRRKDAPDLLCATNDDQAEPENYTASARNPWLSPLTFFATLLLLVIPAYLLYRHIFIELVDTRALPIEQSQASLNHPLSTNNPTKTAATNTASSSERTSENKLMAIPDTQLQTEQEQWPNLTMSLRTLKSPVQLAIASQENEKRSLNIDQALKTWLATTDLTLTTSLIKDSFISQGYFEPWYLGNAKANPTLSQQSQYLLLVKAQHHIKDSAQIILDKNINTAGFKTVTYTLNLHLINSQTAGIEHTMTCQQASIGLNPDTTKTQALEKCIQSLDKNSLLKSLQP